MCDSKIVLIFGIIIILIAITVGYSEDLGRGNVISSNNGRYAFGQTSVMRSDQFMIDTQTGLLWQMMRGPDSTMILVSVKYVSQVNGEDQYSALPPSQNSKK